MRRYVCLGVSLLLAGCGSAHVLATPVADTGVSASCAGLSPAQQFAAARLVFVGRMLPGPTVASGARGVLGSPATMRVARYLKGHGPVTVRVDTGVWIGRHGIEGIEDGIEPHAGERWKIYTSSRRQPFQTSICAGSGPVVSTSPAARALSLWSTFPVDARPRPIVPLGEGLVLDPRTGFRSVAQKVAYVDGHFALRTTLPVWLVTFGSFHVVSADVAYRRLRVAGHPRHDNVPPLIVTAARPGTATFVTDRGRMRLPTWQFFFQGVADPASVLAVGRPDVFPAPSLHRFAPPGTGNSIEDSAVASSGGTAITISFVGAPAGNAPCDASYTASAVADERAVAFAIKTIAVPVPAGEACSLVGYTRTAVLRLQRPIGPRVLVSAADGGAVAVTPHR